MDDLTELMADWPADQAAVGVSDASSTLGAGGDVGWKTRIASVTKLLVGWTALIALEEGSISLDDAAGPEGSTVEHLLAHASGLAFDSDRMLSTPGRRRIYSNTGIEVFCGHLQKRTGMAYNDYLNEGVLGPLGMSQTELVGSPAHGVESTVSDLLIFAREVLEPTLISPSTVAEATRPHFPDLPGVLPGVGSFDPNPWGLTFELRDSKTPHWTGEQNSPGTFGHFGGSGSFLWVDPSAGLATVSLSSQPFGKWALTAWPLLSDSVLDRYG